MHMYRGYIHQAKCSPLRQKADPEKGQRSEKGPPKGIPSPIITMPRVSQLTEQRDTQVSVASSAYLL